MPTYVYQCVACGEEFEKIMSVAKHEKARPTCPACKSRKVKQVLGGFFAKTRRKS
jgi:putative FmdB family regulatory protein